MKRILPPLLFLLLLSAGALHAVPALTDWVLFRQPNSETLIHILMRGDERVHWAESEEGYSLLYGPEGALYYAQPDGKGGMMPSEHLAMPKEQRSPATDAFLQQTPKALRYSQQQVDIMLGMWQQVEQQASKQKTMDNVLGEKRFLVVLFAFQDQHFTHSKQEFQHLFNQVGYSANSATGSVHDYYYDVSHGQFSLQVDIVGPFTGVENTAYYGNNDDPSYGFGYQAFATEAVDSAAQYVDFSNYDNDHDGYIDGLHIIFAGCGEEAGAGVDKIWSHKWNIFSEPTYNNTIINVYSCSPECAGSGTSGSNNLTAIGVICHELGHVFGSPDYYDTDYAGSGGEYPGLGQWDIMSSGSWNASGRTPAHHNPYTKIYIYQWATCDTLDSPQQVRMESVATSNTDFHRINTSDAGDFFLLENRQKTKWDNNLPGTGLLVYHVHPSAQGANVANYKHPQQIYIMAATNDTFPTSQPSSYGTLNASTAPYPGTMRRTTLADNTCPALCPWSRNPNGTPLSFISENPSDRSISFCFMGTEPAAHDLVAYGASDSAVRLDWLNHGSLQNLVVLSPDGTFGTVEGYHRLGDTIAGGGIVAAIANSNSACITGLNPLTTYHFRLYTRLSDTTYASTVLAASGTTLGCASSEWSEQGFEDLDTLPDCWEGDWNLHTGRCHSGQQCLAATGTESTITSSPFFVNATSNDPFVVSFYAHLSEEARLEVLCRASVSSEWVSVKSITRTDCGDHWAHVCATIPNPSDYTLLRFRLTSESPEARAEIDDISIQQGYLLYAFTTTGGTIDPLGYTVAPKNDTIFYQIQPAPGYQFANLYVNGEVKTNQVRNGIYAHRVRTDAELRFTFMGDGTTGIEEHQEEPLRIFPNPTTGLLLIEGAVQPVQLYDLFGRRLMEGTSVLDLSPLPCGLYLLRYGNQTLKIIKQ